MRKTIRTSERKGNIITSNFDREIKRKNLLGRDVVKTIKATTTTNLDTQKTKAVGSMSKTVSKNGVVLKKKEKALSARRIINRGY